MATAARRRPHASKKIKPPADAPQPPDVTVIRQRWIPRARVDWVKECDRIMMTYGVVQGSRVYEKRSTARWRAGSLMRLMVELRLHERWELAEHTEKHGGGWVWTVEYKGRNGEGSPNDARPA